jgi:hypothetical protein
MMMACPGGGITPDGINVDSGVLNQQLNAEEIGPRLGDRREGSLAGSH